MLKTFYCHNLRIFVIKQSVRPLKAFPSLMFASETEAYLGDARRVFHGIVSCWPCLQILGQFGKATVGQAI
jgi:hypothetical protein